VTFSAIAFNRKGIERAVAAGAGEIAVGTAASETFSQRNTNCTIAESLARVAEICELARQRGLRVRGYVSTVLGCPYEGEIDPSLVADLAARMVELGCYEISLGDTIGVGTPAKAQIMIDRVAEKVPHEQLALHFHDTYGQALANIVACLERGVAVVDSSVAGLGGCPYAPGAACNVASEDVLYLLDGLGIESGVNLEKLAAAGRFITGQLGRPSVSRVAQALESQQH
ncbi:MAG: hydroxymethylglutaryl-CoA lyase, partial [Alphaproteobacteria bacterium]